MMITFFIDRNQYFPCIYHRVTPHWKTWKPENLKNTKISTKFNEKVFRHSGKWRFPTPAGCRLSRSEDMIVWKLLRNAYTRAYKHEERCVFAMTGVKVDDKWGHVTRHVLFFIGILRMITSKPHIDTASNQLKLIVLLFGVFLLLLLDVYLLAASC